MELAYIGLEIADRPALEGLLGGVFGLEPGGPSAGAGSAWRNDDKARRIILHDGPANDAVYAGFEYDDASFGPAVDRLRSAGADVVEGRDDELTERGVEALVRARAPWGLSVELVVGLEQAAEPFDSALVPGGFLTDDMGFGHAVFQVDTAERFDDSDQFVTQGLDFNQSDWFESGPAAGGVVARFYHCNPRHHTLAIGFNPAGISRALNHIMLETRDFDDVGAAYDRALQAGISLDRGLGRHDNDRMFSFYALTTAGFRFEFGSGARKIVQPWQENRRYDRGSVWGHHPSPV